MLAYGFDLGTDFTLRVEEVGEFGGLKNSWFNCDHEDDEERVDSVGLREVFGLRLWETMPAELRAEINPDGDWRRADEGWKHYGTDLTSHGHSEGEMQIALTAGDVREVENGEVLIFPRIGLLDDEARELALDERLKRVVQALDITPVQQQPAWMLLAYYG